MYSQVSILKIAAENSDKDPKFEGGNRVKLSKYKRIFSKFILQINLKFL